MTTKAPHWSRRLSQPVKPRDGPAITTLKEAAEYMIRLPEDRVSDGAWVHLIGLLQDAAERNGDLEAIRRQLKYALMKSNKLDMKRTAP